MYSYMCLCTSLHMQNGVSVNIELCQQCSSLISTSNFQTKIKVSLLSILNLIACLSVALLCCYLSAFEVLILFIFLVKLYILLCVFCANCDNYNFIMHYFYLFIHFIDRPDAVQNFRVALKSSRIIQLAWDHPEKQVVNSYTVSAFMCIYMASIAGCLS